MRGLVLGPAFDAYGSSVLLTSGWLLSTFCLMMLSLSKTYYQIFLSQGLGFGIGIALQFYPLLVVPSHWFLKKRALAMGIVVAGSSLSGVIFPIMLSRLFQSIGFPWAVRTLAFMCFALQAISIPFVKERFPARKGVARFDETIKADKPFLMHLISGFFMAFGLYAPFWYIELYGLQQGVSANLAFYLISIMNASGVIGRVVLGHAGDKASRYAFLTVIISPQI
ncbi:Riboflavin transporter MCH5 [Grifola frondosa]|uniref:Riboflavin transporter MCH5 n=1 Tax=Grifola frondosa TaxID=5627 RepID=A0A1C7M3M6_GRIFR|nr:Riboflavin transporter MCH5 [Grifola frondosa]